VPDGHRRYRQLREQGVETQVTLVDPDVVESSNIFRQNFSAAEIGRNKAETLAVRLSAAWGLEIHAQPAPFRSAMVTDGYGRFTVVIGCVDNAAARRTLAEALDSDSCQAHWIALSGLDPGPCSSGAPGQDSALPGPRPAPGPDLRPPARGTVQSPTHSPTQRADHVRRGGLHSGHANHSRLSILQAASRRAAADRRPVRSGVDPRHDSRLVSRLPAFEKLPNTPGPPGSPEGHFVLVGSGVYLHPNCAAC
jgi:hypothetical protein